VFGYAQAAAHWQRAIELCQAQSGVTVREAIDALAMSGNGVHASVVAEDAYRRFADHPDRATAAVIHHRAAYFRAIEAPDAGLPLIRRRARW
jgi:hypothetical protein